MKFLYMFFASLSASLAVVPNWKKCPASDSKANECLREAVEVALKDLGTHGNELGFQNINVIRYQNEVPIINAKTGPFRGKLIYNDITVTGLQIPHVTKLEKKGGGVIRIEFFFPMIEVKGKYFMDTVLLAVPMKGNGDFEVDNRNVSILFDIKIKSKTIDGVEYYHAESVTQLDYSVGYLQMHHSNLFGGNEALGDNINKLLNEQWRTLAKELGPIAINSVSPIYVSVTNSILNKIPVKEFPIELE